MLLVALASTFCPMAAIPAEAFDDQGPFCGDRTAVSLTFKSQPEWNAKVTGTNRTLQHEVQQAHADWRNQVESWIGGAALTNGSETFQMMWSGSVPGGTAAFANCPGGSIVYNLNILDRVKAGSFDLRGLATHELGHMWGLGHAGRYDSFGGGAPTMSTCWGESAGERYLAYRDLSQDDEAAIQFQTDKSGAWGSITANSSWEEAWQYWGRQDVTTYSTVAGGVDGSGTRGRFGGATSTTAVYSTTRFTDNYRGHVAGSSIKGRANYRLQSTASSGTVLVVSKFRNVDFHPVSDAASYYANCQYRDAMTRAPKALGDFSDNYYTQYCTVLSSWSFCTTGTGEVGGTPEPDGVDVRIVVYNRVRVNKEIDNGRPYAPVDVDRVRALLIR